jgi:hypothetical protein
LDGSENLLFDVSDAVVGDYDVVAGHRDNAVLPVL